MVRHNNPYYNNCKHLRYIYPKTSSISAYYVVAWCERFMINVYRIKNVRGESVVMCCVSNSPYMECNCKEFDNKEPTKQTTLF